MTPQAAAALALVFSGLTALVYEIVWTRLLGFVFGTTSEAIGTVLAVFFGGMALGNWLAARYLHRVRRPLRLYAFLELGIGLFALASLPLLLRLDSIYAWVGPDPGPGLLLALRLAACGVILLPPTVAMGATLPAVARGVVGDDRHLGRWSAWLYASNTLGSVAGAYLCGFWMIPFLGLTRTVWAAGAVNVLVALAVWAVAGRRTVTSPVAEAEIRWDAGEAAARHSRRAFLVFFGLSGFVAIGYEIVWSKLFGIVMEGTLYGFASVLSAYLFGIGLGSLAIAPFVDRIRDLPRAFGLLHVATAGAVAGGLALIPLLPYVHARLAQGIGGGDPTHLLYVVAAPIVLLPAALFGAAFPVLIRIYAPSARAVGEGMGRAVAVNTLGSIAASLLLGFWANTVLGMDATLFALIVLDFALALVVLLRFQVHEGGERVAATGTAAVLLGLVCFSYNGVGIERTIAGREIRFSSFDEYQRRVDSALSRQLLVLEGKNAVVTVSEGPNGRGLRTNGLPEAGTLFAPPYIPTTTTLLGIVPYLLGESPRRALVVGLGGGNTVDALRRTALERIDVVELEAAVVEASALLHAGRGNPLEDPRVQLIVNDGRNELLRGRHRGGRRYDLIASQPSHPWLIGAANLFTEEYFRLARDNLREGGVFALWVNGFRTDTEALLSIVTSFDRLFPGGCVVDISQDGDRSGLLLLGSQRPVALDLPRIRRRLAEPEVRALLELRGIARVEDLLARFEGVTSDFAEIDPHASNTDDNAFVETRIPRRASWANLDFGAIEVQLAPEAPLLPPLQGDVDLVALADAVEGLGPPGERGLPTKLERVLRRYGSSLEPVVSSTLAARAGLWRPQTQPEALARLRQLGVAYPTRPEPLRVLGRFFALERADFGTAAEVFAEAYRRSGASDDAFDVARALDRVDPEAAWRWTQRIPEVERARYPRLALYGAKALLRHGAEREPLARAYRDLRGYRDTHEGRILPGVDAALADVADALGDRQAAAAFRESDRRQRELRARPVLVRARRALGEGHLDAAARALDEASRLLPGNPAVLDLGVQLAARRRDRAALEESLAAWRTWSPSLDEAVGRENRFRLAVGLPLLPPLPADALVAPPETRSSRGGAAFDGSGSGDSGFAGRRSAEGLRTDVDGAASAGSGFAGGQFAEGPTTEPGLP